MKLPPKRRGLNHRSQASSKAPTFELLEPRLMLSGDSAVITLLTTPPQTVAEGQALALSASCTDSDVNSVPHTLSINWGDGTDPESTQDLTQAFNVQHTYADNGDFTINISVSDTSGEEGSLAQPITVTNVAPTVTLLNNHPTVLVGGSIAVTAETSDPGSQDTVGVAWDITRDGTSVASGTGQTITYSPSQAGDYLVTATATDNDGGQTTTTSTVTAVPNDLTLSLAAQDTVDEGSTTAVTLSIEANAGSGEAQWDNAAAVTSDTNAPINDGGSNRCSYLWVNPDTGAQTLYFSRVSSGASHIAVYSTTRASSDVAFGPASLVYSISGSNVSSPWVSDDGLRLYVFRSTAVDPVGTQLQCISRASTDVAFDPSNSNNVSNIEIIGSNEEAGHYYDPTTDMFIKPSNFTLSSDELTIIFDGPYNYDLYTATRSAIGQDFTNITRLERDSSGNIVNNINTSSSEWYPSLSADGLTLYFSSDRNGTFQIYRSTRPSTGDPFGDAELVNISGVDSGAALRLPSISRDGQQLFFAVAISSTEQDLYVTQATSGGTSVTGPVTMTVDWGDGTVETLSDVTSTVDLTHTYADNGTYLQTIFVTDGSNGGQITHEVAVQNVAPTITDFNMDKTSVNENGTVTVTGVINDPGTLDTQTVAIDWGDGKSVELALVDPVTRTFSVSHQYLDDAPSGTAQEAYTITATVTDKDGDSGTAETSVTVVNVAPTVSILNVPGSAAEGDVIHLNSSVVDPGTLDTMTYAWVVKRDGTTVASGTDASLTFTAEDNGNYQVSLTVTDDDTGMGTASAAFDVLNVAPLLGGLALSATEVDENGQVTLTGSITDPGILDTHTVTVDWGDNSTSDIALNTDKTFALTHQYLDDNPTGTPSDQVTVSVTATDKDGGSVTNTLDLTVNNVPPVITSLTTGASSVGAVSQGQSTTIQVNFSDVGTQDTHTVTLDLGDGTSQTVTAVNGVAQINHAYSQGGIYTVTATVTDDDGGSATQQAMSVITGISLDSNGVLNIVGTSRQDVILIRQLKSFCNPDRQTLAIGASFLAGGGYGYGWRLVDRSLVQRIVILAGDGDDYVHVSCRVDVPCIIDGGAGNDFIRGGANGDVLMGDEGYDLLWGGGGNDILIGGEQSDLVLGGSGEDILIDGSTAYDIDDSDVMVGFDNALVSLLDEWNSDGTYEQRLSNIQNGGGENGLYVLNDSTLISDQAFDILYGGSGQDWISYFSDNSI